MTNPTLTDAYLTLIKEAYAASPKCLGDKVLITDLHPNVDLGCTLDQFKDILISLRGEGFLRRLDLAYAVQDQAGVQKSETAYNGSTFHCVEF